MQLAHIILKNENGFQAELLNYGATLWKLWVPDKTNSSTNVVVGLAEAEAYLNKEYKDYNFCLGATIGRYAGRISGGGFQLNNQFYPLNHEITLHGGSYGFDKQFWQVVSNSETKVVFLLEDREGSHGFPGNLQLFATYELLDHGLRVVYEATSDTDTIINMTNHSYFNLGGKENVLDHHLEMRATHLCQTNHALIPTGRLIPISETQHDYRKPTGLDFLEEQSLDTPFLIARDKVPQAALSSPLSGIEMQVHTNQPAMVLFTPKTLEHLDLAGDYSSHPAICFECQNLPDAPNHMNFPSPYLTKNQQYKNITNFLFSKKYP